MNYFREVVTPESELENQLISKIDTRCRRYIELIDEDTLASITSSIVRIYDFGAPLPDITVSLEYQTLSGIDKVAPARFNRAEVKWNPSCWVLPNQQNYILMGLPQDESFLTELEARLPNESLGEDEAYDYTMER